MSHQNKQVQIKGYRLIGLTAGGLILGSAIPILARLDHTGTPKSYLAAMETAGAAALIYVFALYLLKK